MTYEDGIHEVLENLATFCGQGGIIDSTNVDAWIATYNTRKDTDA
jgi:hypothetical protein